MERFFAAALERPAAERTAFVGKACGDRPALRRRLEALLESYEVCDDFLAELDASAAAALLEEPEASEVAVGERVGPYRVLRELGRGGMGVVYLAQRADGQFEQRVALKLVKRGMDSGQILSRFLNERQILARLQDPNIARLLDGGITEDGQPYFAMEYVDGQPLHDYCDQRRLDVTARLRLFQKACQAVQYAHASLIIHRDLKPSNILVTEEGELKLLDFGIAKLVHEEGAAEATGLSRAGLPAMTPEYAAPEQVRGETLTTATDVYALGVVLYELMTGRRPYRFSRRGADEVVRTVCETEPPRPSSSVGRSEQIVHSDGSTETITPQQLSRARASQPERLRRRLAGDLDMVVLKALRKEPERRYSSAEALAEDIRRHLAGFPVQAQKDTFGYRASKFVRRHAVGVAFAAALVLLTIGSAVVMALQQAETARQAAKAEEVKDFVLSLFEVSDPDQAKGETMTARELLDVGAARVEVELSSQPEVQAEMMMVVGEVYQKLGLYQPAQPLLEQALALRQSRHGPDHPLVADSLVQLGRLRHQRGDYDQAESLYRRALAIRQQRLGDSHQDVATVVGALAMVRWRQGDSPAADALGRQALAIHRSSLDSQDPALAESLTNLGVIARTRSDYDAAETFHREALEIRRVHYGDTHHLVAESLKNLALVLHNEDRYDEAESSYREALAVQTRLFGDVHPEIGSTLNSLGALLHTKGSDAEAEELLRRALAVRRQRLGPAHGDIATTINNLATVLDSKGDPEAALLLFGEALAMDRGLRGPDHPDVATHLNSMALTLRNLGRFAEAAPLLEEVVGIYRARLGPSHPWISLALANLGAVRLDLGDAAGADSLFRQALAVQREALPVGHTWTSNSLTGLGRAALALGHPQEAEPLLREALAIRVQALPEGHWRRAETQNALGACLSALGQVDEAERLLLEGFDGLKAAQGAQHQSVLRAARYLVAHYQRRGQPDRAVVYQQAALRAEPRSR